MLKKNKFRVVERAERSSLKSVAFKWFYLLYDFKGKWPKQSFNVSEMN